ncbi:MULTISPECIES: HlyD family secretion protein [Cysteiniphilum]|uniref:Multidrug resistance protein A n=1 Tax=Cysteiniphilum litorale TaxID=2056700 RepID=A0A8J3E8F3_9GAMM|nr:MULTISPECIES: HlyD family secretion protein [Cysteiniphilum]GGF98257.1 multidrug resistance protein A [Cysteiniphilum litorale]
MTEQTTEISNKTETDNQNKVPIAKNAGAKAWKKYAILGIVILLCVIGFYAYVKYTEIYPSTDDAYVNADVIHMSAQVTGKLDKLYISNNQEVKKGELLFTIEPQSFEYELAKAKADLTLAQEEVAAIKDSINLQEAKLKQAQAQKFVAEQKEARIAKLVAQGMVSKEDADEAKGDLEVANANVNAAFASIAQEQKQLTLQQSKIAAAKADVSTAALNLSYTKIYASTSGFVTNFTLRPGSLITQNQNLFVLVSNEAYWLDANFKETQMSRMKVGQKASVILDMYPNVTLHGTVQSISEGSGSVFSLLPPENASGNWVKVVQRFPVKVVLDQSEVNKVPRLRVGASATVEVDTNS